MSENWAQFIAGQVDRVEMLTEVEHRANYRLTKPVIVSGGAREIPAFRLWDQQYLRDRVGLAQIRVFVSSGDARDYRLQPEHAVLSDFLLGLGHKDRAKPTYFFNTQSGIFARNEERPDLSSGWGSKTNPGLAYLERDFRLPTFLQPSEFLFAGLVLGAHDTAVPAHYDEGGEAKVLIQLRGRKRILLFPPSAAPAMYVGAKFEDPRQSGTRSEEGTLPNFGGADLHRPDLGRFPAAKGLCGLVADLEPGDLVYWPSFWFHDITNFDPFNLAVAIFVDEVRLSCLLMRHLLSNVADAFKSALGVNDLAGVNISAGESVSALSNLFHRLDEALITAGGTTSSLWEWKEIFSSGPFARAARRALEPISIGREHNVR